MNLQGMLVKDLQANEQVVQIVTLDDLINEYKSTAKKLANWVAPALDAIAVAKIINELGFSTNKVVIKTYAGKKYIIFKGTSGNRKVLRGTRYLVSNPKVVRMAVGPKGLAKSIKSGFVITTVLSVGIEVFDFFIKDSSTLSELLGTVSADLIKIGLSTIAATVAGMLVGASAILGSIAAAPLIAAVAVGVLTGLLLDRIDDRFGATRALIEGYKQMGENLDAMVEEFNRGMNAIEKNPSLIECLFAPCDQYY